MNIECTELPGCFQLRVRTSVDKRGSFMKTFETSFWKSFGLRSDWQEEIHTRSKRNVVRGMHFQTPPAAQAKLLFCVAGMVNDVVLDLRRGSPTFGEHLAFTLCADEGTGLYVPSGLAHGFVSMAEASIMFYKITGAFSPMHDGGVAWDSFGYKWPNERPLVSDRDKGLPRLADYDSPFVFDPTAPAQ